MATEIIMPKVDMVMETGTLVEWLKKEGETVEKGVPLFVILTDKATIEIEAPESGVLAGVTAKPDDVIPVTQVIGYILKPGESLPAKDAGVKTATVVPAASPAAAEKAPAAAAATPVSRPSGEPLRATPVARTLAKEMGLNLEEIQGRGPRGRIYRADVLAASAQKPAVAAASARPAVAAQGAIPLPDARVKERVQLKGPRAIIAQRMAYSASTIPHINETVWVNMEEVVRLREKVAPALQEATGQKVTYTAIIAHTVARTLTRHPFLNSTLDGNEVVLWEDVNLGLATSLDDYLIVPVIRRAQERNLGSIAAEMGRLLDAARSHHLDPKDMTGSTFTITNLGMFGIEAFTAIINPPETAILAVGKMSDMPVAENGQVVIRPMVNLTLAVDHRVNDGARAAKFLMDLKAALENPYLLL